MNPFPASPRHQISSLDGAVRFTPRHVSEPGCFLTRNALSTPFLTDFESEAFWSGVYGLRGGTLQAGDKVTILPGLIERQQEQIAQAVADAVTAERNHLARELHDAVTQTLFAASLTAEVLPDLWDMDEAEARKSAEELRQLTRGALAEMRTLLFELRPTALNQARLPDLLKQLSEAVTGRKCLPISLEVEGECEIPCNVKVEMYRIAQESLNNIIKYARATQVQIKVYLEAGHIHMEIKDNGVGFDTADVKLTCLGLHIMQERAEAIHAQLQVVSQSGMGTTISLDWQE